VGGWNDLSTVVIDDRYRVIEPIARGAMGTVYRGERLRLGRAVAIKVMHAALPDAMQSRERFEREAKLMALLEHPHCVSVIDFGVYDEKPYLVMDLVRGASLFELMAKGPLEVQRALEILRQTLAGLAHAHGHGIIHRDIKPANLMVTTEAGLGDHVRILDFGLARLREQSSQLTAGLTVGTPSYMAPEQCRGGTIDARVDLYACGVVLFEMVTGRKPFVAGDPISIVTLHLKEPPPSVGIPVLEDMVARALAKEPDHRFQTAIEMSAAIDRVIGRRPSEPVMVEPIPLIGSSALLPILDEPPRRDTPRAYAPTDRLAAEQVGSSAIVGVEQASGSAAMEERATAVRPVAAPEPSSTSLPPPSSVVTPVTDRSILRMLPYSRMKYAVLLGILLAAAAIYGIVYAKRSLQDKAPPHETTR
jgi:serine/threonine-protein kinase